MAKVSVAVDMDNVIADIELHYIEWYDKHFGVRLTRKQLMGVPELEAFPDKNAVENFLHTPGFFRTAPVMEGAEEALQKISHDFDLYIVSAAMEFPQSLTEKRAWLQEHFSFISWKKIVFCGNKGIIGTDIMIDDHVYNLNDFRGKGVLFSAAHNSNVDYPLRVNSWKDATTFLYSQL